jgi:GDPmannose 4,6-dehydratase
MRPTDLAISKANPSKAFSKLGWKAEKSLEGIVAEMLSYN